MLKKLFGFGKKGAVKKQASDAPHIDLEMMYCPDCGDEYRAGVSECVGCQVDLISGTERLEQTRETRQAFQARSMDITEADELVVIRGGKLRDLKPYQMLLAKERIPALISGESTGCGSG